MQFVSAVALLVVLALYGAGRVEGGDQFWRKVDAMRGMERCLTQQGANDWVDRVDMALTLCNEEQVVEDARDASLVLPRSVDWNKLFAQFYSQNYRTKRGATFTAKKIDTLKQKLIKRIKSFRCVMQQVGVTDSSNEVSVEKLLGWYRSLSLSQSLYSDIEKATRQCKDFSQCLPLSGRNDLPVPADVLRTKVFLECAKKLRGMACATEDAKPWVGTFDLSGLDGALDFMDSDQARAVAVMWANDQVGYPDYGLYE